MAVTENFFTGNGSTTSYSFTFQYIDEDDIKVTLNGTLTTAYSLANATTVLFNTAPANGVAIRIYRDTNVDNLKATFFAGSAIRAQDLNEDFLQNNYAVQEIKNNTWDNETQTIHSDEAWVSSDSQIATTAAMDARFQDEAAETITSAEGWPDNDDTIATTAAIDNRIDSKIDAAITGDIATDGTGITVTNDGDGTITLGLGANSIDFDRIKDVDIITLAEQDAGSPSPGDTNLFTASAAAKRFDTLVQTTTPSGSTWPVGKTWLQNDADKTLSVWDGDSWEGISSGGTFTSQARVVYVDAANGNDANDGHRISRPKATIKAAITQINADATYGDGSVVVVSPGVYQEVAPIDIQRNNVSIVGQALRSCIVHPTAATETNSLFRVNSGSYIANLTFMGMKASGTRGAAGSIDPNATYGLPPTQGWNVSFFPGATIVKSPYIQNCTNFSDSEINNASLNAFNPAGGSAGDTDSAPTGGGLLVDGSVVAAASPLRSMVCDSYTHVGLDGPAILVTNNGYCQATSSYAFFCHYHIKCLNGGQANLAASTTDFGRYSLIADGKSSAAIFSAALSANVSSGATTFTINTPTAAGTWFGDVTRPQPNMLVQLNGIIYPILSAVANGTGWDVTISRPDPVNRSNNLGLNGAVTTPATAEFFLRSMIASSGHTMEYVGSGTDYTALPENGGVPVEANQRVELNNGAIWTAITDHNGKFTVGDFFEVDQQLGFVTIPTGSIAFDLASDGSPQLGANLDVLNRTISSSTGNVQIDDTLDVTGPILSSSGTAAAPGITFNGDTNTGIYRSGADQVAISTNGTGRLFINSSGSVGVGTASPGDRLHVVGPTAGVSARFSDGVNATLAISHPSSGTSKVADYGGNYGIEFASASLNLLTAGSERLRITSAGLVGIGTSSVGALLHAKGTGGSSSGTELLRLETGQATGGNWLSFWDSSARKGYIGYKETSDDNIYITNEETGGNVIISSPAKLGVGTSSPTGTLTVYDSGNQIVVNAPTSSNSNITFAENSTTKWVAGYVPSISAFRFSNGSSDILALTNTGRVGVGTTSPVQTLDVNGGIGVNGAITCKSSGTVRGYLGDVDGDTHIQIRSESGQISFKKGNNESGRFDTSGRLLVGTSSSSGVGKFVVQGNTSAGDGLAILSYWDQSPGSGTPIGALGFTDADHTKFAAWIRTERDGGTWSSTSKPGRLVFSTTADGASSPTERMRITNAGNVLIGGTSTNAKLDVTATAAPGGGNFIGRFVNTYSGDVSNAGLYIGKYDNNSTTSQVLVKFSINNDTAGQGQINANGASQAAFGTFSDYRLKENVIDLPSQWSAIKTLRPVEFDYVESEGGGHQIGFIAQEVKDVYPDVVGERGDGMLTLSGMGKNESRLIKALQEAMERIEQLEAKVAALEGA